LLGFKPGHPCELITCLSAIASLTITAVNAVTTLKGAGVDAAAVSSNQMEVGCNLRGLDCADCAHACVNGKGAQFDRTVLTSAAMSVGGAVAAWFDRWFQ
jgi:hypothetical protein